MYNPTDLIINTMTPFYIQLLASIGKFTDKSHTPTPIKSPTIYAFEVGFACLLISDFGCQLSSLLG